MVDQESITLLVNAAESAAAAAPQGGISRVVSVDAAEGQQPLCLSASHPFFDGKSETYTPLFNVMPQNVDWDEQKCIEEHFPKQKNYGQRQVPMSLILDCVSDKDKFLVVQWWRSRTPQQQIDAVPAMKDIYLRHRVSNDKVSNEQQLKIRKALQQNPSTKKIADSMQKGEYLVAGMGDGKALRKIGMDHSHSAKVVKSKKRRRRSNEPPSSIDHLMDEPARKAIEIVQKRTELANNLTQKLEGVDFPGDVSVAILMFRTSPSPAGNGRRRINLCESSLWYKPMGSCQRMFWNVSSPHASI